MQGTINIYSTLITKLKYSLNQHRCDSIDGVNTGLLKFSPKHLFTLFQ